MLWLLLLFCGFLALPALLCCLAGGWLLLLALPAVACWLLLAWWVWLAWRAWRRRDDDDYV